MRPKVPLLKLNSYSLDSVVHFVRNSLKILDPESSLFGNGQKVLLKPNLLRGFKPSRCVTTHPVVVEAVCQVLKDLSVSHIVISDSPALGSLSVVARKAGYTFLKKKYGVQILPLSNPITFENVEYIWDNETNELTDQNTYDIIGIWKNGAIDFHEDMKEIHERNQLL